MARDCSDSDSEEERHDRFKSERNPTSGPALRTNIPTSLDSYSSRARSPLRPTSSHQNSRHRSRYSEERKHSHSPRRHTHNREKKWPRDNDKRSGSEEHKDKHRRKKGHEEYECRKRSKDTDDKYLERDKKDSREHKHRGHRDKKRSSSEKDKKLECIKRRKSRDDVLESLTSQEKSSSKSSSEKSRDSDSSVYIKSDGENGAASDVESQPLPRYYEIVDECAVDSDHKSPSDDRNSKKHKRAKDRSENHHDSKKKKKHKRKHRKGGGESDSKVEEAEVACATDRLSPASISDELSDENPSTDSRVRCDIVDVEEENDKENLVAVKGNEVEGPKEEIKTGSEQEEGELSGSESEQYFGPALPPGKTAEKSFGPQLPSDVDSYGPALPPSLPATQEQGEEEDEGDVIGPLPAGHESSVQSALDARASLLKYQMDKKPGEEDVVQKREEWMTELPEAKRAAHLGLAPRKFRATAGPDMSDRSCWTDTPQDKANKLVNKAEEVPDVDSKKLEIIERDKAMEILAKKSQKKSKSLLEMHQKELKKKKKKKDKEKEERRPFCREIDLQTNRFDEAQKRSIIKKAQLLDSRFSSGESKFL